MLVPKLLLTPIKIRIFGPKTAKFGPKYAFLVIFGQILPFLHILSNARPKNKVPRWFSSYMGIRSFASSLKNQVFGPKTAQFGPEMYFCLNIGIFGLFGPMPSQTNIANEVPRQFFDYVGTKTFASSRKNYDVWPKNDQIWSKICILRHIQAGSFGALLFVWWLSRAGCISQDTYLH